MFLWGICLDLQTRENAKPGKLTATSILALSQQCCSHWVYWIYGNMSNLKIASFRSVGDPQIASSMKWPILTWIMSPKSCVDGVLLQLILYFVYILTSQENSCWVGEGQKYIQQAAVVPREGVPGITVECPGCSHLDGEVQPSATVTSQWQVNHSLALSWWTLDEKH